ncbi:MAG: polyphosphate kinase 1 [Rhodocyclaceae bacterium]|jgi:polyphosphate kinase
MIKASSTKRFPAEHFLNRELSLLAFNRRVLGQAADDGVPLLERLRFLCIVSSNLDEFFEIRVAGLKEQIKLGAVAPSHDGLAPHEAFRLVADEAHDLVEEQYALLNKVMLPALEKQGIRFLKRGAWNEAQAAWIKDYFFREVMPVLTPIGLDPAHPFPRVLNKSLNFAIELEGKDAFGRSSGAAIVQAPRVLPRVIRLPEAVAGAPCAFVFLSSVLHANVGELFSGMNVLGCYQFRVTRNSDLWVDEEEIKNLRLALQGELPQRHFGDAVRLEVADSCSGVMTEFLLQQFALGHEDLYRVPGIVNLVRLMQVPDLVDRPDLKYPLFQPGLPKVLSKNYDVFASIRGQDVLLHHPYQSFSPVVEFLEQAVDDPAVVAIKMTVYRTGTDSILMELLLRAARQGKEVTVVVELMARFDEEANINWASRLEEVGAHVVYGVFGYKTHAKMLMVVRREEGDEGGKGSKGGKSVGALRRYVHLGTGNYHPRTARLYTDFGLLTCNEGLCADVNEVFKQLTGLGKASKLNHLLLAPFTLHDAMLAAIRAEAASARAGKRVRIIAKMNALLEPEIIEALYDASQAGVTIDLIIRGACALRPGVAGLSDNISVRSVIGRFLEHTRIFYFHADGAQKIYLSSADWMDRNFFRRIELCFPVLDPKLKRRILKEGLMPYLADNSQAWQMNGDGEYRRLKSRKKRFSAQEALLAELPAAPAKD